MYKIRLYILDTSSRAIKAIDNIKKILNEELPGQYSLEIKDVFENTDMAQQDKIMVTPTVIRFMPKPGKRIIGDFSNKAMVLKGLGIAKN